MRVTRDANGTLTLTNVETFVRVLRALFITALFGVWFAPIPVQQRAMWAGVSALFALALTAADERSLFVFDARAAELRWRKDTPFRHEAGAVPLSTITRLSLEHDIRLGARPGGARRLVIQTTRGPIPVTTAFTGVGAAAETAGKAVQAYLASIRSDRPVEFITT